MLTIFLSLSLGTGEDALLFFDPIRGMPSARQGKGSCAIAQRAQEHLSFEADSSSTISSGKTLAWTWSISEHIKICRSISKTTEKLGDLFSIQFCTRMGKDSQWITAFRQRMIITTVWLEKGRWWVMLPQHGWRLIERFTMSELRITE